MPLEDGKREKHPSYGMIGFSRRSGSPDLFQSVAASGSFITLSIKRAVVSRDLMQDWIFGREELIEVNLSNNQFTELLTTMNVGDGVPCTIARYNRETIESPPVATGKADQVSIEFKEDIAKKSEKMSAEIASIKEMLQEKKTINKGDRDLIMNRLAMIEQELKSNIPFAVKQYERATDKIKTAAKTEVDSFITHAIHTTGLKALQDNMSVPALQIESKDKPVGEAKDE
jgi:hypothetical protein